MLTWLRYLDRVMRGEATRPEELRQGFIEQPVGGLAILGAILGAVYGLFMGCFGLFGGGHAAFLKLITTVFKVPILFFLTLAVTFPSLYVFNALIGSRLTMQSVLRLLVIALAVMLAVLASLGPIVAFFSASTTSYSFVLLLNVFIFAVSGSLGLRYMLVTLQRLSDATDVPAEPATGFQLPGVGETLPAALPAASALDAGKQRPVTREVRKLFRVWMVVFGMVGTQMAWVLRPFIGNPGMGFSLFRPRESSFIEALIYVALHMHR
jgi:hypothetical protein